MTRTQLILIAVLVLLISLFSYSVWKSGEGDRQAKEFIQKIHSHISPGASRIEIEAYLQHIGASAVFDPPAGNDAFGVERAVLFDVRRAGNKRRDLRMEFYFSPDDILQHYTIKSELVAVGSPRNPPEARPAWERPPEGYDESTGEDSEDAGVADSPAPEPTPAETDPATESESQSEPVAPITTD